MRLRTATLAAVVVWLLDGALSGLTIVDLVADDPDESGVDFDEYDTLAVHFSAPTNQPLAASGLARSDIDALLSFSTDIVGDYWAFWNSSRVLMLHFGSVEARSAPLPGAFTVSCRPSATEAILPLNASQDGTTGCVGSSPPLRGAWGYTRPSLVEISSLVAHDPDNGDEAFSAGDVLTLRFSTSTNRAGRAADAGELSAAELDELLAFSPHPTGAAFAANWSADARTLTMRVEAAGTAPPRPGNLTVAVRRSATLRDAQLRSIKSSAVSPRLVGDWGSPPRIVELLANDPASAHLGYGAGDTLTLRFDVPTDTPPAATRVQVDRLLAFSQHLGLDYTGAWHDASTLRITIVAPTTTTTASPEVGQLTAKLHGPSLAHATLLHNARNSSPPSRAVSPPLSGSWGELLAASTLRPAFGPAAGGGALTVLGRGFGRVADAARVAACVWSPWGAAASQAFAVTRAAAVAATGATGATGATEAAASVACTVPEASISTADAAVRVALMAPPGPQLSVAALTAAGALTTNGSAPPAGELSSPLRFSYHERFELGSVHPVAGTWRGGTAVTFHGRGVPLASSPATPFPTAAAAAAADLAAAPAEVATLASRCRFGEGDDAVVVRARWPSPQLAVCVAPPWHPRSWLGDDAAALSRLPVRLLPNGHDAAEVAPPLRAVVSTGSSSSSGGGGGGGSSDGVAAVFTHYKQALSSVAPHSGPRAAGWALTVYGRGLAPHSSDEAASPSLCRVGDAPPLPTLAINASSVAADGSSAPSVVCFVPPCVCPPGYAAATYENAASAAEGAVAAAAAAEMAPECCSRHAAVEVLVSTAGVAWPEGVPTNATPDGWVRGWPPLRVNFFDESEVDDYGALPHGTLPRGPPAGGVPVTLTGSGFGRAQAAWERASCLFGANRVRPLRASRQGVVCIAPPGLVGTVPVAVAPGGSRYRPYSPHAPDLAADYAPYLPPPPAYPPAPPPNGTAAANAFAAAAANASAGPGLGASFTYECGGYVDAATCAADPACAWCAARGCVACLSQGAAIAAAGVSLGLVASTAAAEPALTEASQPTCGWGAAGPIECLAADASQACGGDGSGDGSGGGACAACGGCRRASRKQRLKLGPYWRSVRGTLRSGEFALFQIEPPHTNVALRLSVHYPSPHAVALAARRDLPPRVGYRAPHGLPEARRERYSQNANSPRRLVIDGRELGCGQRDGRRQYGAWPDLLEQQVQQGWSPLQREQVGALYETRWWNNTHGEPAACDAWFVALEVWSAPAPPPSFLGGRYEALAAASSQTASPIDVPNPLLPLSVQQQQQQQLANASAAAAQASAAAAAAAAQQQQQLEDDDSVSTTFELRAALEPQYNSFTCRDCAPAPPMPAGQFSRFPWRPPPPPPRRDRHGVELRGDCEACDMVLRGSAEQVVEPDADPNAAADTGGGEFDFGSALVDPGGQRLRLVHSVEAKACQQVGAAWYSHKLRLGGGFGLNFTVRFHRPSTCAVASDWSDSPTGQPAGTYPNQPRETWPSATATAAVAVGASGAASSLSGGGGGGGAVGTCADPAAGGRGDPRTWRGAVGGEGIALVLHNAPDATRAQGCGGAGIGYAAEADYYQTCKRTIPNSLALQLVAHQNVTQPRDAGSRRDASDVVAWSASDHVGLYRDGDNTRPLAARQFRDAMREGSLLDGAPHHVRLLHTVTQTHAHLSLFIDHEADPSFVQPLRISELPIADADGLSWVGFTASTGLASMDVDLLSFAFEQHPE